MVTKTKKNTHTQRKKRKRENVPFAFKKMSHSERVLEYIYHQLCVVSLCLQWDYFSRGSICLITRERHTHTFIHFDEAIDENKKDTHLAFCSRRSLFKFSNAIQIERQ